MNDQFYRLYEAIQNLEDRIEQLENIVNNELILNNGEDDLDKICNK